MRFIAIFFFLSIAAMADQTSPVPQWQIDNLNGLLAQQGQIQVLIQNLPDWQSLTNDRASYVTDKDAYTGSVAAVSDANTKQAIKQLAACVQDCQAQISDLKRVILAIVNSTTNNAIISQ